MSAVNHNEQQPTTEVNKSNQQARTATLPVVGIGASAGGLQPLRHFLEVTPADSGMAYVIVIHLSPDHESHLAELLDTHARIPVQQVMDTVSLEPDHVYVIPPNRNLSAIDTQLRLDPLENERSARAPIDHFLRTLAEAHQSSAIGIVLSGTGADGAHGVECIKEYGGLTIAQDPSEAEYDSMPLNAIATNQVDLVLPVRDMPDKIIQYFQRQAQLAPIDETGALAPDIQDVVQKLLTQVRVQTGHDFSRYKLATIVRRIQHRMQICNVTDFEDYLTLVRTTSGEALALFNDFLITVTHFFRDLKAFEALAEIVIPQIVRNKTHLDQVRVWSIGCATGEEAYSLAMLLMEQCDQLDAPPSIQIFASDLSELALRRAREGLYPDTIAADVSAARLQRFFVRESGGYRIRRDIRELVLFTHHNVLKDAPFSRLDLIVCRNMLIYLGREVQLDVFRLYHYALRPGGFLFLGSSEVLDDARIFHPVDHQHSIYERLDVESGDRRLPMLPLRLPVYQPMPLTVPVKDLALNNDSVGLGLLHDQLLERFAPPSLMVDANYEIVRFSLGISRYLVQPAGVPTNNILRRMREEFRNELATLLFRAFERKTPGMSLAIPIILDGAERWVTIGVWPSATSDKHNVGLVLFYERAEPVTDSKDADTASNEDIRMLQENLFGMRRRLQVAAEEFETSQEEMSASNEELQSINEELRSTAEELETSKEELQSINEELITVNQENKHKVEELSQLASDLRNLLAATDIATLFLDSDLRITLFTPRTSEIFNVQGSDRGRPLAHITHKLGDDNIIQDAETVLHTLIPIEREVTSQQGRTYLMRLLPYRTIEDHIEGMVVTFVDITERVRNEQKLQQLTTRTTTLDERVLEGTKQIRMLALQVLVAEQKVQERMAQVLHDDLQQILYGARMHLKIIQETIKDEPEVVVTSLKDLDDIMAESLSLTRRLINDLAPPVLDREDLIEIFQNLTARMGELHGLHVALEAAAIPLVTNDNLRLLIYQVVRELLFNVVKHAKVSDARLEVSFEDNELCIQVEDTGCGFDMTTIQPGKREERQGFGLPHAAERLTWLGGRLEFESIQGKGTRVTVVVPLSTDQPSES